MRRLRSGNASESGYACRCSSSPRAGRSSCSPWSSLPSSTASSQRSDTSAATPVMRGASPGASRSFSKRRQPWQRLASCIRPLWTSTRGHQRGRSGSWWRAGGCPWQVLVEVTSTE
ncbi:unnamed protein product, partial [Polarella glacialis]